MGTETIAVVGLGYVGLPLATAFARHELQACESIILTVANCGTRANRYSSPGEPHDDGRAFRVEIYAGA